jgi:hypothetical protein
MKIIKLTETQLKEIVNKVIKENEAHGGNYMFFSNLEQIKRQCELLLQLDESKVNELLNNGHDWADDHISTAKENMDQVFDFMMNEFKGKDVNEAKNLAQQAAIAIHMKEKGKKPKNESYGEIDESKNCPTDPAKWAASKAAAKAKFDVYPSAYANGWAAKNYKAKGGGWKKCK